MSFRIALRRGFPWVLLALTLVLIVRLLIATSAAGPDAPVHTHVDGIMFVGHVWNLQHGQLAGRDYVSTYGPLAQALASLGASLHRDGDVRSSAPLVFLTFRLAALAALTVWLALLPAARPAKIAAALLLLTLFAVPRHFATLRPWLASIALVLVARALATDGLRRVVLALAAALGLLVTQLVTPDFAIYAAVALVAAALAFRLLPGERPPSGSLAVVAITLATWVAGNLLLWVLFGVTARGPEATWLDYPRGLLELIRTYSWAVGRSVAGGDAELVRLGAFLAATFGWTLWRIRRLPAHERFLPLLLAAFALLSLRGGMVRSGAGHVALALTGTLALWLVLAPGPGSLRRRSGLVWAALGLAAWLVWPDPAARRVPQQLSAALSPSATRTWASLRTVSASVAQMPGELRRVLATEAGEAPVFPYPVENELGPYFGRPLLTPTHQAYAAHDVELQRRVVAALRASMPPPEVVFTLSGVWGIDLAANRVAARTSGIFEYLLHAYRWQPEQVDHGRFRLTPAPWRDLPWRRLTLAEEASPEGRGASNGAARSLRLSAPATCRVVALDVQLDYPSTHILGWLVHVRVGFLSRGVEVASSRLVPLRLDAPFRVLVPIVGDDQIPQLFRETLPAAGTEIDEIRLAPLPGDWLGFPPRAVAVLDAECL